MSKYITATIPILGIVIGNLLGMLHGALNNSATNETLVIQISADLFLIVVAILLLVLDAIKQKKIRNNLLNITPINSNTNTARERLKLVKGNQTKN